MNNPKFIHSFTYSFILETYIAPAQNTITQWCSQTSHGNILPDWNWC